MFNPESFKPKPASQEENSQVEEEQDLSEVERAHLMMEYWKAVRTLIQLIKRLVDLASFTIEEGERLVFLAEQVAEASKELLALAESNGTSASFEYAMSKIQENMNTLVDYYTTKRDQIKSGADVCRVVEGVLNDIKSSCGK